MRNSNSNSNSDLSSGFTLVELLVGMGLMSVVALGSAHLVKSMLDGQALVRAKSDHTNLVSVLRAYMRYDPTACQELGLLGRRTGTLAQLQTLQANPNVGTPEVNAIANLGIFGPKPIPSQVPIGNNTVALTLDPISIRATSPADIVQDPASARPAEDFDKFRTNLTLAVNRNQGGAFGKENFGVTLGYKRLVDDGTGTLVPNTNPVIDFCQFDGASNPTTTLVNGRAEVRDVCDSLNGRIDVNGKCLLTVAACPTGQFLKGIVDGVSRCEALGLCAVGEYLSGFNGAGKVCLPLPVAPPVIPPIVPPIVPPIILPVVRCSGTSTARVTDNRRPNDGTGSPKTVSCPNDKHVKTSCDYRGNNGSWQDRSSTTNSCKGSWKTTGGGGGPQTGTMQIFCGCP